MGRIKPQRKSKGPINHRLKISSLRKIWHNFLVLDGELSILYGRYSQTNKRYKPKSNGHQGACNSIIACLFYQLYPMERFSKDMLDVILDEGDCLCMRSFRHITKPTINIDDALTIFFYEDYKYVMQVEMNGADAKLLKEVLISQLEEFFNENHKCGILEVNTKYFAICKDGPTFYLLDATEHDQYGQKWTGIFQFGFCCLYRVKSVKRTADIIIENSPKEAKFAIFTCNIKHKFFIDKTAPNNLDDVEVPCIICNPDEGSKNLLPEDDDDDIKPEEKPKPKKIKKRASQFVESFSDVPISQLNVVQSKKKVKNLNQNREKAIGALVMLREKESKLWSGHTISQAVKIGEKLCQNPDALPQVDERTYKPFIEDYFTIGHLQSKESNILDLIPALSLYLTKHDGCIVMGPLIVAVWLENGIYYLFDPNGRVVKELTSLSAYKNLGDIGIMYLDNVDQDQRRDQFSITKVIVEDFTEKADPWYDFQGFTTTKWILQGEFSQNSRRFPKQARNCQDSPNAIIALATLSLHPVESWNVIAIHTILENGQTLYSISLEKLYENDQFHVRYLTIDEITKNFNLEEKEVNIDVDCLVEGELGGRNLLECFELYLHHNKTGVLTIRGVTLAFWMIEDGSYFYFDPYPRNDKGKPKEFGFACCLRFLKLDDMVNLLETNLPPGPTNDFKLYRVTLQFIEVSADGILRPSLHNFHEIDDNVAILRSELSEDDPKFGENSGKQAVPMCLMSLGMTQLIPINLWTTQILSKILDFGNDYYGDSLLLLDGHNDADSEDEEEENYEYKLNTFGDNADEYEGEENEEELIDSSNVEKHFKIGINHFEIDCNYFFEGTIDDGFEDIFNEYWQSDEREKDNLLLESERMTAVIWKDGKIFYLFDPEPRDSHGCGPPIPEPWVEEEEHFHDFNSDDASVGSEEVPKSKRRAMFGDDSDDDDDNGDDKGSASDDIKEKDDESKSQSLDDVLGQEEKLMSQGEIDDLHEEMIEEEGKACVLRFCRLEDLAAHIIKNLGRDHFLKLTTIKIENTPTTCALGDDWGKFKQFCDNQWIIRGTKNLYDKFFPEMNRGKQSIPICLAALAFNHLYNVSKFEKSTVDDILTYGDRLFTYNINENPEFDGSAIVKLQEKFCIADYRLTIDLTLDVEKGDIRAKPSDAVKNLQASIRDFFTKYDIGILHAKDLFVTIWIYDEFFYMFDGKPRGPNGVKSPIGVACLTRFQNHHHLANVFLENLEGDGSNFFFIHSAVVSRSKCPLRPTYRKPFGGYTQIDERTFILRGTKKIEDDEISKKNAAMVAVCLSMTFMQKSNTWTKMVVDKIQKEGDFLYFDSAEILGLDSVDIFSVKKDFLIKTIRVSFDLRPQKVIGEFTKRRHLRKGLENFFFKFNRGILVVGDFTFAVWLEGEKHTPDEMYFFDANSRGPTGLPVLFGSFCVLKFSNANSVAEHILNILKYDNNEPQSFIIIPIDFAIGEDKLAKKRRKKERSTEILKFGWQQKSKQHYILCGTNGQLSNRDITTNLGFYITSKLLPLTKWRRPHIDFVMQVGNQLYIDSMLAYTPSDTKLGLENILRKFFVREIDVNLTIYKPVESGDLTVANMEEVLGRMFIREQFCMIVYKDKWFGLCREGEFFYWFNPYLGKLNKYTDLATLINQFTETFRCDDVGPFTIILVKVVF